MDILKDMGIGLPVGGVIKSKQSGVASKGGISLFVEVSISEVDIENSVIVIKSLNTASNQLDQILPIATFIDSTTIRFEVYSTGANITELYYDVIEFDSIRSLQKGIVTSSSNIEIPINTVNLNNSFLITSFRVNSSDTTRLWQPFPSFLDENTVKINIPRSSEISWSVVEVQ